MTLSATLALLALASGIVAAGFAVAKNWNAWRTDDVLIPVAIVFATIHRLVSLPDVVQSSLAILSLFITGTALVRIVRRKNLGAVGQ